MAEKSKDQKWLEDFLGRTGIDSPRRSKKQSARPAGTKKSWKMTAGIEQARDKRRGGLIDRHGLCKKCKVRAISGGGTEVPEAAKDEDQCLKCYIGSRRRAPGRPRAFDPLKPMCLCCTSSNVTTGESKTAGYARRAGLCIRCYCAGRRGGDS